VKSQGRLVTRMLGLGWDPPRSQSSRYPPAQAWNLSLSLSLSLSPHSARQISRRMARNYGDYGDSALYAPTYPARSSVGFGPRSSGRKRRRVWASSAARKLSEPIGRPRFLPCATARSRPYLRRLRAGRRSGKIADEPRRDPSGRHRRSRGVRARPTTAKSFAWRTPSSWRRVQRHIAESGGQMRHVHRDGAEPSLPEVAGAFTAGSAVAPMVAANRSPLIR